MHEYSCVITRVVDGDTVDVDIDLGFDMWLKKHGNAAKEFVKSYLPVGTKQTLKTKLDGRGKFGRILGEFVAHDSVNGRQSTINQLLIDNFHAVQYHGQSKEDIGWGHLQNRKKVKL